MSRSKCCFTLLKTEIAFSYRGKSTKIPSLKYVGFGNTNHISHNLIQSLIAWITVASQSFVTGCNGIEM